ncbi:MAG: hypothetical protein HQL90_15605 [Magnetococcales bacterium]|nr:hypothetical protein [Magnetococcales bacterium]
MINRDDLQKRNLPVGMDLTQFLTTRTTNLAVGGGQLIYMGFAYPGSDEGENVWMIQRVSVAADGSTTTLFAGGQALFNQVWADRLNLNYS